MDGIPRTIHRLVEGDARGLSFREDEIFSNLFSAKEYAELERIPPESLDRPKRAIELLQPAYDVPDQLKEKIFQLYKERRHLFK